MRIIDADTLKAYFFRPYSNEESYSNIDIEKIIDEQTTIKPEQKIGKWKKILIATVLFTIYGYDCPFCEFRTATDSFHYCPNCGAKMEVDE